MTHKQTKRLLRVWLESMVAEVSIKRTEGICERVTFLTTSHPVSLSSLNHSSIEDEGETEGYI